MYSHFQPASSQEFAKELAKLRPHDAPDHTEEIQGFTFLATPGHGFLVVPKDSPHASAAKEVCQGYGHIGKLAYYLEEDCQAGEFLEKIK